MYVERYRMFGGQIAQFPSVLINDVMCPGDCRDLMQRICLAYGTKMPEPCKGILTDSIKGKPLTTTVNEFQGSNQVAPSTFSPFPLIQ